MTPGASFAGDDGSCSPEGGETHDRGVPGGSGKGGPGAGGERRHRGQVPRRNGGAAGRDSPGAGAGKIEPLFPDGAGGTGGG